MVEDGRGLVVWVGARRGSHCSIASVVWEVVEEEEKGERGWGGVGEEGGKDKGEYCSLLLFRSE